MAGSDNQPGGTRAPGSSSGTSMSSSSAARPSASAASDVAQQATQQVREQTSRATEQAQQQAQAFLSQQKEVAAGHIESVAQVLHQTVDQLRERSPGAVSDYAERAVGSIDSLAKALRDQDIRGLVGQVEDFARRQPVLFMAGTVAAGFALARFLKSSSQGGETYGQDEGQYTQSREGEGAYAYPSEAETGPYGTTSPLSKQPPAMSGGSGQASPQYSGTRSTRPGTRATAEEIQRAMSKEPE